MVAGGQSQLHRRESAALGQAAANAGRAAIAVARTGPALFAAALVAAHVERTDLRPGSRYLSEYAVGSEGWLMSAGFLCLSAGVLGVAQTLARQETIPRLSQAILLSTGVGMLIGTAFPTDSSLPGAERTWHGHIHNTAAAWSTRSAILGMGSLSYHFYRDRRWNDVRVRSLLLTLCAVTSRLAVGRWPARSPGWPQRAYFASYLLWLRLIVSHMASSR